MFKWLIIFTFFLVASLSFGQSQKQLIQYADENYDLGDFYGASIYYEKALKMDSTSIHLLYKYATALRKYNNYTQAEYYYAKIFDKDLGGRIYPDAVFWLGIMQKNNGLYKDASKSFKKSKSVYGRKKKEYNYLKSKQEIGSCSYAKRTKSEVLPNCTVVNLGEGVNTTNSEFSAFEMNEKLYFTSLRTDKMSEALEIYAPNEYKIAIFQADTTNATWQTKDKIDTTVNSVLTHNANGCFNTTKNAFYFTRCDSLNNCKLYISKFNGKQWDAPTPLPEKINSKNATTITQPNVGVIDGKEYLFYASNDADGFGNLDIYFVPILDGGTFGKPKNAGKNINTPDPDITPFYHSKEKVLYFSSSWHNGFGGFDVFKSGGDIENLNSPENLLAPINTQWNDFYYTLDSTSTKGYLTSNRLGVLYKKGPTCCNDIWQVDFEKPEEIAKQEIKTLDDINKFLPVTLYFHNDRPGPRSLDTTVTDNYLTTYDKYKALQPTYREEYSKGLDDEKKDDAIFDIDDYFKNYVDKGVSDLELFTKLLLVELEKGEKIEITVKGFASPLAKTEYNVNLTKRRISTLVNFLRKYDQGQFNAYIDNKAANGGQLTFLKIPFGEYTSNSNVSDDYYDQRNSIYNRKAAVERKIEIQSITYAEKDSLYAGLTVSDGTFDFGKVKQGEVVKHTFTIENTGNKPLQIQEVIATCGCNTTNLAQETILPGEKGTIEVTFDTKEVIGKQVKSITLIGDSFPKTKRLVVTAEILE